MLHEKLNSTSKSLTQLKLIAPPEKFFCFCRITYMSFWELNIAYRNGGPYGLLSTKFAPLAQTSCYATGDSDC